MFKELEMMSEELKGLQKKTLQLREKAGRHSPWRPHRTSYTITLIIVILSLFGIPLGFQAGINSIGISAVVVSIGLSGLLTYLGLESMSFEETLNELQLLYDRTFELEEALFKTSIYAVATSSEFRKTEGGVGPG
jgi:hypothetical protein